MRRIILIGLISIIGVQLAHAQSTVKPSAVQRADLKSFGPHIVDLAQRTAYYAAIDTLLSAGHRGCPKEPINAVTNATLSEIENSMAAATDESGRVFALEIGLRTNGFTVRQINRLVGQIKDGDGRRARLLKLAYDRCTDTKAFHLLAELLVNPEDRQALLDHIVERNNHRNRPPSNALSR